MSRVIEHGWHLTKRFFGSWSRRPLQPDDLGWVRRQLLGHEFELWSRHVLADKRHTAAVGRTFAELRPEATRAEIAGALLHDIGKVDVGLSVFGRVIARLVGGRSAALRRYLDHENIGADLLAERGSDPATVELVRGRGPAWKALYTADNR